MPHRKGHQAGKQNNYLKTLIKCIRKWKDLVNYGQQLTCFFENNTFSHWTALLQQYESVSLTLPTSSSIQCFLLIWLSLPETFSCITKLIRKRYLTLVVQDCKQHHLCWGAHLRRIGECLWMWLLQNLTYIWAWLQVDEVLVRYENTGLHCIIFLPFTVRRERTFTLPQRTAGTQ